MSDPQGWLNRYYPVPAREVPVSQATAHSLRKWEGLRKDALDEYGLNLGYLNNVAVTAVCYRTNVLTIDNVSCALCIHHQNTFADLPCPSCPLAIARGGVACTQRMETEARSPWAVWVRQNDPEPMIQWLRRTLEIEGEALTS